MLVSHRKKFIYTKTVKTAGTSVESYFEPYCRPEGTFKEDHWIPEHVSDAGIVGHRGRDASNSTWWGHMPAYKICELVGPDIWDGYFKFTVIRNPFDKLISAFSMVEATNEFYGGKKRVKNFINRILGLGNPYHRVVGNTEVERFRSWIKLGGKVIDRDKYLINGEVCMDYFIRFEELQNGVDHVFRHLGLELPARDLPQYKKGMRKSKIPVHEYYDEETREIVARLYAWELEFFGYGMPGQM